MSTTIIHIDMDAVNKRLRNGELWTTGWGDFRSPDGETCLHGAIRYCQPVPGDANLIEQVGERFGFGTSENDECDSWECVVQKVQPDITDDMLAETFGPQWEPVVALVRRAAVLTSGDEDRLRNTAWYAARNAAWYAAWNAAWNAARYAARDAAWAAAWDAARSAARNAARDAARDAARSAARDAAWNAAGDAAGYAARNAAEALAVRDLIGQHGFTQEHYDTLTEPWRQVIGPVHPDDIEVTA